jgi:hypothetical protein
MACRESENLNQGSLLPVPFSMVDGEKRKAPNRYSDILKPVRNSSLTVQIKVRPQEPMSLNDLEFAYAPVRNQVRDLREYL